jgi:CRISPR type I-E-associated protein CasB/Cse2
MQSGAETEMGADTSFEQRVADYLHSVVEDRARRAILRRCVPGSQSGTFEVYRILGAFLPELEDRQRERCVLMASYLVAAYPECWTDEDHSLGRAARTPEGETDSESFGKRFTALLDSNFEQLEQRLPQFVSLLNQKGRHASLARLIRDLLGWNYERHPIQRRWARDYFVTVPAVGAKETLPK